MTYSQNLIAPSLAESINMKNNYDYAAEMVKIAESAEHQKLFGLEKLAFSRDGQVVASEVEEEVKKLAKKEDCDCEEDCEECDCECHDKGEKKEASDVSLEDTAGLLLEISNELENQGQERLAAASLLLADSILKTAAKKKKPASKSKSKSKGKKMSMKERMEKMRAAQGKGKAKSKDDSDKEESESEKKK